MKRIAMLAAAVLALASIPAAAMTTPPKLPPTPAELAELDQAVAKTVAACNRAHPGDVNCGEARPDLGPNVAWFSKYVFLMAQPARARGRDIPGDARAGYEYGLELSKRICASIGGC